MLKKATILSTILLSSIINSFNVDIKITENNNTINKHIELQEDQDIFYIHGENPWTFFVAEIIEKTEEQAKLKCLLVDGADVITQSILIVDFEKTAKLEVESNRDNKANLELEITLNK